MRKALCFVVLGFTAAGLLPASAFGGLAAQAVVATDRYEVEPTASPDYLVYSRDVAGHPQRVYLIVRHPPDPDFRVNPVDTIAYTGGIDGTTLAFSQRPISGGGGNIRFLDLVTKDGSAPAGVNTARHESQPDISGDWLLFVRSRRLSVNSPRRILLRNLDTNEQRELDFGLDFYVQGGGLAGNYAVWTRCVRLSRCRTLLHDIAANTSTLLPNPRERSQFAASVTADGSVYYAESRTILCSRTKTVRFYKQPLGGPRELLLTLPEGKDTGETSPVVLAGGAVDLYFDRYNGTCTKSDIYKIPIPAPTP